MRTAEESNLLVNRLAARIKQCRLDGLTDRDTATALLAVVDSHDIAQPATEDDMTTIRRIGHGMARNDVAYCLEELEKARLRKANA